MTIPAKAFLLFGIVALCRGEARAQAPPDVFGTEDEGITVLGFQDFFPLSSDTSTIYGSGFERITGGDLVAGMNMLPNGSVLTQVTFYVRDDAALVNLSAVLCWTFVHSTSGQGLGYGCAPTLVTAGQPGETTLFQDFDPPLPILYRQDVDGDGITDAVNYTLFVYPTDLPPNGLGLRMVRLRWKRQVSPAPAAATFNDVPTSHPFFQFVEALAASGITAGCGGGNYCPDAPLTRGQMAVFLSKALGLHWPWDAQ